MSLACTLGPVRLDWSGDGRRPGLCLVGVDHPAGAIPQGQVRRVGDAWRWTTLDGWDGTERGDFADAVLALLRAGGAEEPDFEPTACPRCGHASVDLAMWCSRCRLSTDEM